jgi:hypothetical protein
MKNTSHIRAFWLIALLAGAAPQAAWAFRCGNRLVDTGDTAGLVRAKCGDPTDVHHSVRVRPPIIWHYGRPVRVGGGDIEIPVETWTYNLGPNRLMQQLRLENGIVTQITTLGYGYR